jgi:hypothetical protein
MKKNSILVVYYKDKIRELLKSRALRKMFNAFRRHKTFSGKNLGFIPTTLNPINSSMLPLPPPPTSPTATVIHPHVAVNPATITNHLPATR